MARGAEDPALDQQFSGVHRPHLPGAVRGGVHAEHRRQPGHDQNHRMRDRRPRLAGGLDRAAGPGAADRQEGRGRRLGPGRDGLRPAIGARRAYRHLVRKDRPGRRAAALRHPRLQDGEVADRPACRADDGGGRELSHRGRNRRRSPDGSADRGIRRRGADRRRRSGARSRSCRARARRHPLRDGLPAAAEQAQCRRRRGPRRARRHDHRRGQACRRDRRRRHRLRLHRHRRAPARGLDHPARDPAKAARARKQGADLARLAAEIAHLVLAGRRLRARLGGVDQARIGRERPDHGARMRARRLGKECRGPLRDAGNSRAAGFR